jgi:hypothetical protein
MFFCKAFFENVCHSAIFFQHASAKMLGWSCSVYLPCEFKRKFRYNPTLTNYFKGTNNCYNFFFIFYYLVCEAIATAATPGLLCQPRVIMKMIVEKQMECRLAGETEISRENLPQRHFCPSQNPT